MPSIYKHPVFSVCIICVFCSLIMPDDVIPSPDAPGASILLRVGIYNNKPKIFIDEKGVAGGFWADLLGHIAKKEGWKLAYVFGSWDQCLERLEKNEIDIMPDVAFSKERAERFAFSTKPAFLSWSQLYVGPGSGINSILDLRDKNIAVLKGSVNYKGPFGIKDLVDRFDLPCTYTEVEKYTEIFKLLEDEKADAGVVNKDFGMENENQFDVVRSSVVFQPTDLLFAFPKNAPQTLYLIKRIDLNLEELKNDKNSIYYRLLQKYIEKKESAVTPKWTKPLLIAVGGVILFFFVVAFVSRRQAAQKTAQLRKELIAREIAEKELLESEVKYRSHFENASDVIYSIGSDFKLLMISPSIERVLGYKPEELVGRPFTELNLLAPGYLQQAIDDTRRVRNGESLTSVVYEFITKSGEKRFGEVSSTPLMRGGKVEAVVSVARDITERKRSEQALKEAHERLLTILDSIDTHIYVADMKTHEILFINKLMKDDFGEDFTGRTCYRVFRNETAPCTHCTNPHFVDEEGNLKGAIVWEDQNPITGRWYINHHRGIKWVDGRNVWLQLATDITLRKEMEHQRLEVERRLSQVQKMEAIGTLAGGIAHDFNNILTAVIGYTDLAIINADNKDALLEDLQQVLKAGKRARDLVMQILTFSRQSEQKLIPIQVKPIAKECLKLFRATLPSTIAIRSNIESAAVVMADPTQIHQVLMNLCTNANHAMQEKGGILEVDLTEVRLDSDFTSRHPDIKPGTFLKMTVRDTGYGIAPDMVDKIFDPFFTTKEKDEGTGMGLSVVHGIVKSLGGAIAVYSEPEKGTEFNIYLPVIESESKERKRIELPLPTGTEHILFVDDELSLRKMIKQILESLGYHVEVRSNGIEALELFKANPDRFDLVITDMTMPGMTGDLLAEQLIAVRPDIPVILCTGFSARMDEKEATVMGIRAFILKPIIMSDIAKITRRVLDEAKS